MANYEVVNVEYNSIIEKKVGLPLYKIMEQSCSENQASIENRIHQNLTLGKDDEMDYRGSMLLAWGLIDYNLDCEYDKMFLISK